MADYLSLPDDLPVPVDDGKAAHLPHIPMPHVTLRATDGSSITLDTLDAGLTIIYIYPLTGKPGVDLPAGWDEIPGARGCTPESCGFRDHYVGLQRAGVSAVFGLSSQATDYQAELAGRLALPFAILSDPDFELAAALDLPTFETSDGQRLYKRLTLVIEDNQIEHVFYPIFPPDRHAAEVLAWLGPYSG